MDNDTFQVGSQVLQNFEGVAYKEGGGGGVRSDLDRFRIFFGGGRGGLGKRGEFII